MAFPSVVFGRIVLSFSLGIGLVAGAGLAPAFADQTPPPVAVAAPGSEESAQIEASTSGQDVVVDDATTPTEVTVAHPDGTMTRTVHAEPVRMETATGWKDISTDLVHAVVDGEQVLKPEMVPVDVSMGTAGTDVMATLDDGQGHTITQSWPFGDLPTPSIDGNTATYAGVLPGVDLVQIAHNTGVSQVLKIASAAAAADPRVAQMRLFLDSQNVAVTRTIDGGLQAKGTDTGAVEMRTASGQWWDSSQPGASVKDPGGPGVTRPFSLTLGNEDGQQTQKFGMNTILSTPGIEYPIFVDPDWSTTRASYIYVDSGYPTMSYLNGQNTDSTLHVGFLPSSWAPDQANHVTRAYYQFVTSPMAGKVIISAKMDVLETYAPSCTATPVSAWVSGGISSSTTWNTKPALLQKVSTLTIAKSHGNPGCEQGTVTFDMGSAKGWLTSSPQWTVALLADNESDEYGWKRFDNNPLMRVTYDTPPATPGIYTISGGLWNGTAWAAGSTYVTRYNNPVYSVRASDPDLAKGGNITVTMKVKTAAGALVQTGPAISGAPDPYTMFSWQGGTLNGDPSKGNTKYILEAQTKDQQGLLSGVMSFPFTVDTTPPPAPVITATSASINNASHTDNTGVIGETKYTLSLTKGSGSYDVEGFVYSIRSGPVDTTYPVNLVCNTRVKEFVVVCGSSASITVAAVADITSVRAWAFDTAGNVNLTNHTVPLVKGGVSPEFTFSVGGEQHAVPSTVLPVTLKGGATWANVQTSANGTPNPNSCTGSVEDDGSPEIGQALELTGSGDYGTTTTGAIDTAKSFSLAVWFCPKTPKKTTAQAVLTQLAAVGSPGAALMINTATLPQAELNQWTGLNGAGKESSPFDSALMAGNWYYVAAVSDVINQQLRITLQGGGFTGTWTVATASATHLSSPTTQPVLLGASGPSDAGQFTGQIFNPVMTNGVLPDSVFTRTRQLFATGLGVKK